VAIALVNTSMGTSVADPVTFSFTCNATTDLLVTLYLWRTTGTAGGIGNPTFGAQTMTTLINSAAGTSMGVWLAYLYAPTTGSAQTWTGDMTSAATAGRWVAAAFSGADSAHVPSTGADTYGTDGTTTATPTVSLSPTATGGMTITGCSHEGAAIMTAKGAGQTGLGGDADGFVDEGVWNTAFTYELNPPVGADADVQTFTNAASDVQRIASAWFATTSAAATSDAGLFDRRTPRRRTIQRM